MRAQDARQFDMFSVFSPPPPVRDVYAERSAAIAAFTPANMVGRDRWGRPEVQMRAASNGGLITMYDPESPEPFEVEVRGIPCIVSFHGSYQTHVINPVGSLFWSETGFRSFGLSVADPAAIIADIERYSDAPAKDSGGCGGKLKRWWPSYVQQWQQSLAFELGFPSRADVWDQWGPETHAEHWANHDAKMAKVLEQMRADGIDLNDVGKPSHFRGTWPVFS